MMTMRESSWDEGASKSITAARISPAAGESVWACKVAPAMEAAAPAVRTAPAPIRYSLMGLVWHPGVPTGWPCEKARQKNGGAPRLHVTHTQYAGHYPMTSGTV